MIVSRRKILKIAAPVLILGPRLAYAQVPLPRSSVSLNWPAGRSAGVNLAHPAAKGLRFSSVAVGGQVPATGDMVNLLTGTPGVTTATAMTSEIDGNIGPVVSTVLAGVAVGNDRVQFPNQPAVTDSAWLSACIYRVDNGIVSGGGSDFSWFSLAAGNSNAYFGIAANQILIQSAPNFALEGPTLAFSTAYFLAASVNAAKLSWLVLNLQNGDLQAGSDTGFSTANASDGTYEVGIRGNNIVGQLAASMYSATFFTVEQLIAWGADPWSFWYPPNPVMAQLVGTTPTGAVPTLPMTGFGQ